MTEQGGFGRMQLFYTLVIIAGINSVGWEQYDNYITNPPLYDCHISDDGGLTYTYYDHKDLYKLEKDDPIKKKCTPTHICDENNAGGGNTTETGKSIYLSRQPWEEERQNIDNMWY